MVLDFRTVKGAFPGQLDPLDAARPERFAQRSFGAVPDVVRADALFGSQRELDRDVIESEVEAVGLLRNRVVDDTTSASSWDWAT